MIRVYKNGFGADESVLDSSFLPPRSYGTKAVTTLLYYTFSTRMLGIFFNLIMMNGIKTAITKAAAAIINCLTALLKSNLTSIIKPTLINMQALLISNLFIDGYIMGTASMISNITIWKIA